MTPIDDGSSDDDGKVLVLKTFWLFRSVFWLNLFYLNYLYLIASFNDRSSTLTSHWFTSSLLGVSHFIVKTVFRNLSSKPIRLIFMTMKTLTSLIFLFFWKVDVTIIWNFLLIFFQDECKLKIQEESKFAKICSRSVQENFILTEREKRVVNVCVWVLSANIVKSTV